MRTITGRVKISRVQSNFDNPTPIEVRVMDDTAGVILCVAKLSLEQLADVMTNREVECTVEIPDDFDRIGKTREHKEERVKWDSASAMGKRAPAQAATAIRAFEVDGWRGAVEDLFNHHRRRGDGTYLVRFERWV